MTEIVPTITATDAESYARSIGVLSGFASRIHIDVTDGEFAPSRTVNLNQVYWDKTETLREIDLHLMMKNPIDWLDRIVGLSPDLAIFHAESNNAAQNLPQIFRHLEKFNIKSGLALLPETNPLDYVGLIKRADTILIFGGHLGYQGGVADLGMLEKVKSIKDINLSSEISWDGGANESNVSEIAASGVDVINVGSAISNAGDPELAYERIRNIIRS